MEGVPVIKSGFLRLGVGGLMAAISIGLLPATAGAGLPVPTPRGDDIAYLSFATVAERVSRDFYRAASAQAHSGLTSGQRRHLYRVASTLREHIMRLDSALGQDAPLTSDFVTVLPTGALSSRASILGLGNRIETLLVRGYLTGVSLTQDAATRLLLSRLLAYDDQQLAWLRGVAGLVSPGGLLGPIDLESASTDLDAFLSTPAFPD